MAGSLLRAVQESFSVKEIYRWKEDQLINAAVTTSWAAFAYVTVISFATRKCYSLHLSCSFLKQPTYPPLLPSLFLFHLAFVLPHNAGSHCCPCIALSSLSASSLNINTIRGAGLAQFYRLQLARLINLQRIAHSDYTVTLPPSIPTRGLLVHYLLSQSHSHLTLSRRGYLCTVYSFDAPYPPLSTRGLLVHCLLYCSSTLSSSRQRVGCTLPVGRTQHPTKPSLVSV